MIDDINDLIKLLERTTKRIELLSELLDMFSTRTDEMSKELKKDFIWLIVKHSGGTIDDNPGDITDTK